MTTRSTDRVPAPTDRSPTAYGGVVFAAMLMILAGTFQAVQGLVALVNDDFYVTGEEYIFRFDLTTWGWVHLVLGVIVALAGGLGICISFLPVPVEIGPCFAVAALRAQVFQHRIADDHRGPDAESGRRPATPVPSGRS